MIRFTCFILELDQNTDGTEDLFSDNLHIWLGLGEDRRVDEVPLIAKALASQMDLRTLLLSGIDVTHDTLKETRFMDYYSSETMEQYAHHTGFAKLADLDQFLARMGRQV